MAEVFGEWRRRDSTCDGEIILWLRDLEQGAGWGILDHLGRPKVAYHHLRRALQPVAVWTTDEGLNGLAIHAANDRSEPLVGALQLDLYRDHRLLVGSGVEELSIPGRSVLERDAEQLLGYFADITYAYRFGAPQHDLVVATLAENGRTAGQSFYFPLGRPTTVRTARELGLDVVAARDSAGGITLDIQTEELAYGVRVSLDGYAADDNGFSIQPAGARRVQFRPTTTNITSDEIQIRALNLNTALKVRVLD